jgi:predicted RNA-binding protein
MKIYGIIGTYGDTIAYVATKEIAEQYILSNIEQLMFITPKHGTKKIWNRLENKDCELPEFAPELIYCGTDSVNGEIINLYCEEIDVIDT